MLIPTVPSVARANHALCFGRVQRTLYLLFEHSAGYALFERAGVNAIAMQLEEVSALAVVRVVCGARRCPAGRGRGRAPTVLHAG